MMQGQMQPQGQPVTIDAVVALLRDDRMRTYRIEVETDSLVEADQNAAKQRSVELISAVGEFFGKLGPIMVQMPVLAPMFGALLQDAVRKFKVPSSLEEQIEKAMEKAGMLLMQPKPPPEPTPDERMKMQATQVKAQAEIQKAQIGAQQAQMEGQAKVAGIVMDHQAKQGEHAMRMQQMNADRQVSQEQFMRDQANAMAQEEPKF